MRERNLQKLSLILLIGCISCISLPDKPKTDTEDCVGRFFQAKRRMREVQIENRNLTAAITGASLGVGFWVGPVALAPLLVLPFTQYNNKERVDEIRIEYESKYCGNQGPNLE